MDLALVLWISAMIAKAIREEFVSGPYKRPIRRLCSWPSLKCSSWHRLGDALMISYGDPDWTVSVMHCCNIGLLRYLVGGGSMTFVGSNECTSASSWATALGLVGG